MKARAAVRPLNLVWCMSQPIISSDCSVLLLITPSVARSAGSVSFSLRPIPFNPDLPVFQRLPPSPPWSTSCSAPLWTTRTPKPPQVEIAETYDTPLTPQLWWKHRGTTAQAKAFVLFCLQVLKCSWDQSILWTRQLLLKSTNVIFLSEVSVVSLQTNWFGGWKSVLHPFKVCSYKRGQST